jgi:tetratricopeptide repeat protein 8
LRVGTASALSEPGGVFVDIEKLDLRKYAARPALARALCDYCLYHDRNPRKAVELCALATVHCGFKDWWWKERLGKGYYQLGLLRDAEKQFRSSLNDVPTVVATLQLAKIHLRLDQPLVAVATFEKGFADFPGEISMLLGQARICDALGALDEGVELYKQTLRWDASNVEAVACLAASHFYGDQPELALRYYRRLLQMGVHSTALWNNIGLCCFYAGQYDVTLHCFERALQLADDDSAADVWFNVGHVAIGVGDLDTARSAFEVALGFDSTHHESFNNLGVLESKIGHSENAMQNFALAAQNADWAHEPFYNHALCAFREGDFQQAFERVERALEAFPEHAEGLELRKMLIKQFTVL